MKPAHKIDNLRQAAHQGHFSPPKWIFAKDNTKRRLVLHHPGFPIDPHHRHFAKVRGQCGEILHWWVQDVTENAYLNNSHFKASLRLRELGSSTSLGRWQVDRPLRRAMLNKCGFAAQISIEHGTARSTLPAGDSQRNFAPRLPK